MSFLYRVHRDALTNAPGARVYYEDHSDFNDAFDRDNPLVRFGNLEFLPSRVLFDVDLQAYKAAVNDFIAERDETDDGEPEAQEGETREDAK